MMRTTRLLTGCAIGAVLAAMSSNAAAQSFVGAPTVVAGTAVVTTGPGVTDILVSTPEVVINWQADDPLSTGLVNFQPGGVATFGEDPSVQDYTVLNRILPVDGVGNPINSVVSFNGTVQSFLKGVPGGHIWFYSPTGIIIGPTAVFNVGSLILTTNDIPFPAGGSLYGPGGLVQLIGPAGSTGFVDVRPGAQLSANGVNAYLALVAPRVVQGGLVQANGQIAYLAAEQVDMTINGGLFDFVLTVGTTDANGIEHTGTTTGPESTSAADMQRISLVALPKNDAMTMLLAGSIGYAPAALAANEGSSVVLAAGFDTIKPTDVPANTLGTIDIGNATFRNALTAYASNTLTIAPVAGTTAFQADAALYGRNSVGVTADTGERVTATNDLLLRSGVPGAGGAINVQALGTGLIDVAGTLGADASSGAAVFVAFPGHLDATGGTVAVTAIGGTINALDLVASADAFGNFGDSRGGIATGGTVDVTIASGGTVTAGLLGLTANALGGPSARSGGDGTGGAANLILSAGTLTASIVSIESNGGGGAASASPVATAYQSGHGTGGTSGFTQNGGTANVTTLTLQSDGTGVEPMPGATGTDLAALSGNGTGGTALLRLVGGSLTTAETTLVALGFGGGGMDHAGSGAVADGGIGTGGTAALQSPAGSTNTFSATILALQANGQGGDGGTAPGGTDGNGGNGAGFSAAADLADGAFALGAVMLQSTGTGGIGALGGEGSGAQARFAVIDTGGPAGARSIGSLVIDTSGFGNAGAASDAGSIALTAQVLDAASALDFTGDLTLTSTGTRSAPGNGIAVIVGGAPLTVGGNIAMTTTRDVAITAVQPLRSFGNIGVDSRAFVATGLVDADGTLSIVGTDGVAAERLESGGTTLLQAVNGPVLVSTDLASAGAVTALGRSIDITSLGALTIADAQATAGNLRIVATGDLTAGPTQATGTATLTSTAGAFVATNPVSSGGALAIAGNGGVNAGTVTSGGTTSLQSANGAVQVGDLTSAGLVTAQARSLDLQSPGSLAFASAQATGGDLLIQAADNLDLAVAGATGALQLLTAGGNVVTGNLTAGTWTYVEAAGSATLGNIVAATDATASTFGGNLTVGNVTAGDDIWLSVFGADPTRVLNAGNLTSTGLGDDAAAGPPVLFAGAGPTGNVTRVRSSGSLTLGAVQTPGRAILVADNGGIGAGLVTATEAAILLARGNIALAGATTTGRFYVADSAMFAVLPPADYDPASLDGLAPIDTSGSLTVTGAVNAGTASVTVGGNLTIAGLTSGGTTLLRATGGAVDIDNLLSTGAVTALGRSVDLVSTGALTFADLDATAGALSVQTAGNLTVATADATGAVTLRSTGGAFRSTGGVNGVSIALTASGPVQADAGLTSAGNLAVDAGGTFTLAGIARGTVVGVRSSDIALGAAARIGVRGVTQDVTLTNSNPARVTFIGGAADPAGYSLDQAEVLRIFADRSVTLASAGDVTIRDLALTFGGAGQIGTGGRLEVTTPARVSITGNVALTTSGADDSFVIDPTRIELNTDTGSIALLSAAGNPLGLLAMTGNTIAVGTAGVLGQLAAAPSFAAVNALLDQPGGNPQPLRAGTMTFTVTEGLYIQNTGISPNFPDRAGFAAAGLAINTASANTQIAINGQILSAGGPVTGLATQPLVTINGAPAAAGGLFDPRSTINGCLIGGGCAPPPGGGAPSDSDLVEPLPPDTGTPSLFVAPLVELADTDPLITPPLVDEPITGVGNDDLWEPRCEPGDEDSACPEGDGQP